MRPGGHGVPPSTRRRSVATAALRQTPVLARDHGASTVRVDNVVDLAVSIRGLREAGTREVRSPDGMVCFEVDVAGDTAPGQKVDDNHTANP